MSIAVPGAVRKQPENPFEYTEDQVAERSLALKQMRELWPDVNPLHAEWVYDLCKNTPEKDLQKVMENVVTVPSKHLTCNDPRSHLFESTESWKTSKKNNMHNNETKA